MILIMFLYATLSIFLRMIHGFILLIPIWIRRFSSLVKRLKMSGIILTRTWVLTILLIITWVSKSLKKFIFSTILVNVYILYVKATDYLLVSFMLIIAQYHFFCLIKIKHYNKNYLLNNNVQWGHKIWKSTIFSKRSTKFFIFCFFQEIYRML